MDDTYIPSPPSPATFDPNISKGVDHVANNNNNFVYSETADKHINSESTEFNDDNGKNDNSHDHLNNSSSPHPSSNSSVSSQVNNNEDSDIAATNNNSSPSSPQSSYNSSFGSNSGQKLINSSNNSITALVPGGVVTTQNISTVIRPKGNTNSLQFVKIQTPELSKKAVEQIRIAEATKITKDKIKEVEEEWQNNLLNWKSKRRQQFSHSVDHEQGNQFETGDICGGRKIKTFAEMIEERAKSGRNRLGFHLQRYIGEQDDEEKNFLTEGINQKEEFLNEVEQSKTQADSDCEAHSSTSSSFNQPGSKSSSSPDDIPLDTPEVVKHSSKHPETKSIHCDSVSSNPHRDEIDNNNRSISLIADSESDRLNSTLKQGIRPLRIFSKNEIIIDTKIDESPIHVGGSEASVFEQEDDEEEGEEEEEEEELEEQRQLQRIAFEAKLKAFEKLTKPPVVEAPKIIPKRIVKPPSSVIERQNSASSLRAQQPPLPPKLKEQKSVEKLASIKPTLKDNRPIPPLPISAAPRAATNAIDARMKPPDLTKLRLNDDPIPKVIDNPSKRNADVAVQRSDIPALRPEIPTQRVSGGFNKAVTQHSTTSLQTLPDNPKTNSKLQNSFNEVDGVQKLRNIPNTQPPLLDSIKSTPSPRKPTLRDDKDRTVLSVSGKKRCSSCKEELGRGAAAFVVESLSLVYHTNCFRCSVCHVNLSNGFRGVDVRVHAEALHCQNCYSKDGLNYSRV